MQSIAKPLLEATEEAIARLLAGETVVQLGSRSVTKVDLMQLIEHRRMLKCELERPKVSILAELGRNRQHRLTLFARLRVALRVLFTGHVSG